jgi:1-acyl-sn-glycerol-3-phosphate acyltransferase
MQDSATLEHTKSQLVNQFERFLAAPSTEQRELFRESIQRGLTATSGAEIDRLLQRVAQTGDAWGYYPPEPFARHVHRAMADVTLSDDSGLEHSERLAALRGRSIVFLPNHISYSDANLFEILLHRAGSTDVAERLTVIAGPKVYSDPLRRFLSLCFGTIKTAQSQSLASGEAVMSAREVAAVARKTIALFFQRLDAGDAMLIFAEGTRSRQSSMQPLLPAVARYLDHPGAVLVPVGITGTEQLLGVEDQRLHPTCVRIRIGEPIEVDELVAQTAGKRPAMVERVGRAIAATLPAAYRGVYS